MPLKRVIEHMRDQRKRAIANIATCELCYFRARTFPSNWQVDIFTFRHFIKPRVGGRGSLLKEILTGSLPSFLALVLPYFFSRSPFFSLSTTESLEQARQKHTGQVTENGAKHNRARTGLATVAGNVLLRCVTNSTWWFDIVDVQCKTEQNYRKFLYDQTCPHLI